MDTKQYIESGILSIYVLGAASEEEKQEVELLARQYPEIAQEIAAIKSALDVYAANYAVPAPQGLKERLMHQLFAEEEDTDINDTADFEAPALPAQDIEAEPPFLLSSPEAMLQPARRSYMMAASYILLALSLLGNLYLYNSWQRSEQDLALVRNENLKIADNLKSNLANYEQLAQENGILKNPNNTIITLAGLDDTAPEGNAWIFWDKSSNDAYIYTQSLPTPPEGKQYQLWAVEAGEVWDAGVFELGQVQKVKCREKAEKYVITLEKRGGVPVAEGKAYAIGEVNS